MVVGARVAKGAPWGADEQVIESVFKLREQQPSAIANEMRNALIDTFA